MRERVVLAPGVRGSDFLKNLALHGQNCINLRICGAAELARTALMRSGISIKEDFLDFKEETALVARATEGEAYFGRTTYSDIQAIASAIRMMRFLVTDENEEQSMGETLCRGLFAEKNHALFCVYSKYIQELTKRK